MTFKITFVSALLAVSSLSFADDRVGLSLLFQNGQAAPIKLVGNHSRYLQEVDIAVTSPPSATDQGILPLQQSGEFSGLNWSGIQQVEEDWRSDGGATLHYPAALLSGRLRYFEGAARHRRPPCLLHVPFRTQF